MSSYPHAGNLRSGLPDDLPPLGIAAVDELTRRDLAGERVPSLALCYVGRDGRRRRLTWRAAFPAGIGVEA